MPADYYYFVRRETETLWRERYSTTSGYRVTEVIKLLTIFLSANTTFAGDTQELSKENQTSEKREKRNIGNLEVLQITDTTAQV